jgi:hypothetical protein
MSSLPTDTAPKSPLPFSPPKTPAERQEAFALGETLLRELLDSEASRRAFLDELEK